MTDFLETLSRLEGEATKGPWRVYQDTLLTKDGGGKGEPMQEIHKADCPIARFTIYSNASDAPLAVALRNSAPALIKLVEAAQRVTQHHGSAARAVEQSGLREALAALEGKP